MTTIANIATPEQRARAAASGTLRDKSYPTVAWGYVESWEGYAILQDGIALGHGPRGNPWVIERYGFVSFHALPPDALATLKEGLEELSRLAQAEKARAYFHIPNFDFSPLRIVRAVAGGADVIAVLNAEKSAIETAVLAYWARYAPRALPPPPPVPVEPVEAEARRLHISVREASRRRAQRAAASGIRI